MTVVCKLNKNLILTGHSSQELKIWQVSPPILERTIRCISTPTHISYIPELALAVCALSKLHLMTVSLQDEQMKPFPDALKEKCDGIVSLRTLMIDGKSDLNKFVTIELQGHLSLWNIEGIEIRKLFFVELNYVCSDLIEVMKSKAEKEVTLAVAVIKKSPKLKFIKLQIDPDFIKEEHLKTPGYFHKEDSIEFELEQPPTKLLQISPFQIVVASGN